MAALSGEPKSKEKAGFSRGREGPWAWPPPCACLFASTPSLAPAQSRWPARRHRRPRGVLSSSDAHPLDLPGPLLEARSLLNRTHEHARARGLLIQVPREAGVRVLRCGSVRRAVRGRSQGPGRVGRGPPVPRTSLSRPQNFTQPSPAHLAACAHDVLLWGKQFQLRMWSYEGFSLSVLCGLAVL